MFRRGAFALLVGTLAIATLGLPAARANTSTDLDAARQRLAAARVAATASAGAFAQAESKEAELDAKIQDLETYISAAKLKAGALQQVARERAVYAYTHTHPELDLVVGADDAVTAVRRQQLLDHANQTDNTVVKRLAAINADLRLKQGELKKQRDQADVVKNLLLAHNQELQGKLAEAQRAAADLQKKLDAEIAIAVQAAAKAKLEAERAALALSQPVGNAGGAGQFHSYAVGGGFMCPVAGAAYTDDYGGPRGHPGIDMFVPIGTPIVATKAGTLVYMAMDGAGGNEAYLTARDGNTYYYAHLSAYSGGEHGAVWDLLGALLGD